MAQESKSVARKTKHTGAHRQDEITPADEIEEIEMPQKKTLHDRVTQVMEKFASTRVGQMIIERTDRFLKVFEDTAKWSLPQDDQNIPLVRPLPWLFFLNLIVLLRLLRVGLSIASLLVGSQCVTPESVVYYIQTKRRRLRAIRLNGLKSIRSREIASSSSPGIKETFIGKFRTLLGISTQIRQVPSRHVQHGNAQSLRDKAECSSKGYRNEDNVDLNLTVDQMLDKYANENSDGDSDYVPKDDEDDDSSSSSCTISSLEEESEMENNEQSDEIPKKTEKSAMSKNDNKPLEENEVEIKENGDEGTPKMPKPMCEIKIEPSSDVDSGNEQEQTPEESANTNGSDVSEQPTECGAASEAARTQQQQQQVSMNTPTNTLKHLATLQLEENKQKSTPGHESAASIKTVISTTEAAVPVNMSLPNDIPLEKCYKTVTTQTSIEIDWRITLKTEISQIKQPPKLEKLNCSIPLTPATSTEDIFYSPIGEPQDFYSIFHPAPIVKNSPVDAYSTPKEVDNCNANSTAKTPAANPKKYINNFHNRPNHYQHNNAKNRNKNRR